MSRWDEPPTPPTQPRVRQHYVRDAAVERAARAIYDEWRRQEADRMGVEKSGETWADYSYAVPVFALRIREQAEAALRAVGFR